MGALEVWRDALDQNDRPTLPVPEPRDSGVRLKVAKVAYGFAMVDVVLCDLSRDPRSEYFHAGNAPAEKPPAFAIVAALK